MLTTDTTHHTYFVWRLAEATELVCVGLELRAIHPPFETAHPFEDERDAFERDVLLDGCPAPIDGFASTASAEAVNDERLIDAVIASGCDLVVVFGTTRVNSSVISRIEVPLLNLHGGNPEEYRGLDTHLWAIYHRDFDNLVTTLHVLSPSLDAGDIVSQTMLRPSHDTRLSELRSLNTTACVDLTLGTARTLEATGSMPMRPQIRNGRYYSFMPAPLKDECVRRFADRFGER